MDSIYVLFGSIGEMLSTIAREQKKHSYVLIPESVYEGWKGLQSFSREDKTEENTDKGAFTYVDAYFIENGQCFCVRTVSCRHPDPKLGNDWRFVVDIWRNNQHLSSTFTYFNNFLDRLNKDNPS